jgi:hypothetical protein
MGEGMASWNTEQALGALGLEPLDCRALVRELEDEYGFGDHSGDVRQWAADALEMEHRDPLRVALNYRRPRVVVTFAAWAQEASSV